MQRLIAGAVLATAVAGSLGSARADEDRPGYPHTMYAIVKQIRPAQLVVRRRDGQVTTVDIALARQFHRTGVLYVNKPVALHGDYDARHTFHAVSITGAAGIKYNPAAWPQDE